MQKTSEPMADMVVGCPSLEVLAIGKQYEIGEKKRQGIAGFAGSTSAAAALSRSGRRSDAPELSPPLHDCYDRARNFDELLYILW